MNYKLPLAGLSAVLVLGLLAAPAEARRVVGGGTEAPDDKKSDDKKSDDKKSDDKKSDDKKTDDKKTDDKKTDKRTDAEKKKDREAKEKAEAEAAAEKEAKAEAAREAKEAERDAKAREKELASEAAERAAEDAEKAAEEKVKAGEEAKRRKLDAKRDANRAAQLALAKKQRTLARDAGKFRVVTTLTPGAPKAGKLLDVRVDVVEVLKVPHPKYGPLKPIRKLKLVAVVTDAGEEIRYVVHSLSAAGAYGFHHTPRGDGEIDIRFEGLDVNLPVHVGVWPPPDFENEEKRNAELAAAGSGRRVIR